uniref:Uncharacterized protein n=1 Tax=Timema douglasi TaxID=61478 RepID=A0A7R8ZEJ8_TIMDO|nr:unnamed protein product [Timema douglasi]
MRRRPGRSWKCWTGQIFKATRSVSRSVIPHSADKRIVPITLEHIPDHWLEATPGSNKPTWHPRTQVSFVPRVLQMAPGKPPTFSSNHSAADNPTSSEGKVLSNADFRQMLLGTKN